MRDAFAQAGLILWMLFGLCFVPSPASAKYWPGFFQNYPDVDWLTFDTEHFRIHYYPEVEWTARMMAKYAEIAYPKVTSMFDYPLKERVHIVIRDQEENANGFAVYGSDWITVWATPLYYVLRGRQEWIPDVFTHEFSHIVSLKVNDWKSESSLVLFGQGLIEDGVHNIDFGARAFIGFATPYWWTEGVAEYGAHLAGFNWWTTSRDMHLRTAVLEDNALSFEEMFTPGNKDNSFDREKGYQQGYSLALYVMEKYGKEQFAQMAINSDRRGHLVWEKNIEDVLGVEGHKLYDDYIKWMRARYQKQVAPIKKNLHQGQPVFESKHMRVLQRLGDGRLKVELGYRYYSLASLFGEDEAQKFLANSRAALDQTKDSQIKQEGERLLAAFEANLEQYRQELSKLDDPSFRQRFALAKHYLKKPKPTQRGLANLWNKAARKQDDKKVQIEIWDKRRRKAYFEGFSGWNLLPRFSPNGRSLAIARRKGVEIYPIAVDDLPLFSRQGFSEGLELQLHKAVKRIKGSTAFEGYAFHPNSKKVLFSSLRCPDQLMPCVNFDYYYRYDLYEYDIATEDIVRLTKRLRAILPSYSPDGKSIAFVHIEDGQNHLGIFPAKARDVQIDGRCQIDGRARKKCIKWLIRKYDGTQIGQPSWSPDGSKLVFDLYRNQQQDVWMIDADGSNLHPLTWERAEDRDAGFTPDGKHILYSSDRNGIFNAYLLDWKTGETRQLTNVIGGVFTPHITPSGHLLYSYFTSYGLQIHGLRKENFYNKLVDAKVDVSDQEIARNLAYQEELPEIREFSTSYSAFSPSNWPPLDGVPMFLYERRGISIGAQVSAQDVLGKHLAFGQALLGETSDYRLVYVNNMWYPQFYLGWIHVDFGSDFSQGVSGSELVSSNIEPHFDPPLSYKIRQALDFGLAGVSYDFGDYVSLNAQYAYRYYTSISRTDTQNDSFLTNNSYALSLDVGYQIMSAEADINPQGRNLNIEYAFTRTGLPEKEFADVEWLGRLNPPSDNSDDYRYHSITLSYTEAFPITWWNREGNHTLEFHFRGGWINRNVHRWDEFFAGSLHPLRYVPSQSTTHEFAGYEDFSLSGETMLVFGLAYRFPFYRHIDRKFGPFYFASLWGEIFGTAGNLWGYTGEYVRDKYGNIQRDRESYWDPQVKRTTIRREIPFLDIASKNGNYLLYDIGFVLKLKGYLFGYIPWNSFIRVAYGLNDIIGQYEVNDDRVFVDMYPNDALYSEVEPKSIRLSIGLGSDFN